MQTIKFNFDPLEELIKAGIRIEAKENTELDIFSTAKYRKIFICFIGSNNSNNINYKIEKNDKIVDLIEYENTLFVGLKGGNTFQLYKKKIWHSFRQSLSFI